MSRSFLLFYFGSEAAAVELDGHCVAEGDLGGVAEEVAGGVGGDGVAAFENAQGAALLELQRQFFEAVAFRAQKALGAEVEISAAFFEAQAERGDFHAKVEGSYAQVGGGEAFARLLETRAKAEGEAGSHFIGALALLPQKIERAAKAATRGEFVDAAGQFQQAIANQAGERFAQFDDVFVELGARLDDELGSGGRRRGAQVGNEIGNGEIGFVADAGDHGNFGSEDGARDDFFVEGPQIFHRAAAAGEDEHVHNFSQIEEFQRLDDFLGGAFALHAHGINGQVHVRETPRQDAHNVAHGGAARRGDDADAAGKKRQRFLARRIEKAFDFEA